MIPRVKAREVGVEFRARLSDVADSFDRRTRAYKQFNELIATATEMLEAEVEKCLGQVQAAHEAQATANRNVETAIAERDRALEAVKLRQSGGEQSGEAIEIQSPKAANSRDWTVAEMEEAMFRLRLTGLGDPSRFTVNYNTIYAKIPVGSELRPTKAELTLAAEEREFQRRQKRSTTVKTWRKRVLVGVPATIVGVPASLAFLSLAWRATTYLIGQF